MRGAAKVAHLEKAMDVLEAVSTAKKYILKVFEDEKILNLGLEEAVFDESQGIWHITLGFSRSWDNSQSAIHSAMQILNPSVLKREYKIVEIPDNDNKKISVKNYIES
jgi:flagellar assembly factor FliW